MDEHSSSEDMPYKFNGKELDQETGLYYYGARYMNPRTSLWLNVDPLVEEYEDVHAYCYANNNPLKYIDPDGRGWVETEGTKPIWDNKVIDQESAIKYFGKDAKFLSNDRTISWISNANTPSPKRIIEKGLTDYTKDDVKLAFQRATSMIETSDNPILSFAYDITNDFYAISQILTGGLTTYSETGTNPVNGSSISNLDGTQNYTPGDNVISILSSTMSSYGTKGIKNAAKLIPKGLGYMNKLNATQFSQKFKGNLSRLPSKIRGKVNKMTNKIINLWNSNVSSGKIVNKTKSLVPNKKEKNK